MALLLAGGLGLYFLLVRPVAASCAHDRGRRRTFSSSGRAGKERIAGD
jgi:hypothetical protein